jgi:hypothetical protein
MMKNKGILLIVFLLIGFCSAKTYSPLILEWSSPIRSDAIYSLDLDKDGMNELYVASYAKQASCIYLFDYAGNNLRRNCLPRYSNYIYPHAQEEITLIYVDDLSNDGILDVVAASKIVGTGVNVKKLYLVRREYEGGLNAYKYNLKWDYTLKKEVMDVKAIDIDKDGSGEIIAASTDFNVYVFNLEGGMKDRYDLGGSAWSIEAVDIDKDGDIEILAGSFLGVSLLENGRITWTYNTKEKVFGISAGDVNGDGYSEILAISDDDAIHLLDMDGELIWEKKSERAADSFIRDLNEDGIAEIILLKRDKIYSITRDGNLQWVYNLNDILLTITMDGENNIFLGSQDKLYRFRPNPDYFLNEDAKRLYSTAHDYYLRGEFFSARDYANRSKQLFLRLGDLEEALKCDSILIATEPNTTHIIKRGKADEYYSKTLEFLDLKSYDEARDYAEMALNLYWEIDDKNKSIICDLLIAEIDKRIREEEGKKATEYHAKSREFLSKNLFENASINALNALRIYQELNDATGIANSEALMGEIRSKEKLYNADYLYSLAAKSLNSDDYENATIHAESARSIYIELNESEKINECDLLINMSGRYRLADSLFNLAMVNYHESQLENATIHAESARSIYAELNDTEKIESCDILLSEIERNRRDALLSYLIIGIPILAAIILIAHRRLRRR